MREVILKLDKVEVKSFDARASQALIRVYYTKDNKQEFFDLKHDLKTKSEIVVEKIIKDLKSRGNIAMNDEDILSSIYIKKFLNEEKAEERLTLFFSKLYERGRVVSREKNHTRYMALLDDIQHQQLVI